MAAAFFSPIVSSRRRSILTGFHHSNYFLDLVSALGGPSDADFPQLTLPPQPPEEGVSQGSARPYNKVVLCPGAEYGPAKRWPVANFAQVGEAMQRKYGMVAQILGAPGDLAIANELETSLRADYPAGIIQNMAGATTLEQFMLELSRASVVVCNDSGAMHLASALGVPTVAIFGSTEPRWTGPLGNQAAVLRRHVPCSPCFLRQCPLDMRCFSSIDAQQVINAAEALLPRTSSAL